MTAEEYLRAKGWRQSRGSNTSWVHTVWEGPFPTSEAVDIQVQRDHDCMEFAMHHQFGPGGTGPWLWM